MRWLPSGVLPGYEFKRNSVPLLCRWRAVFERRREQLRINVPRWNVCQRVSMHGLSCGTIPSILEYHDLVRDLCSRAILDSWRELMRLKLPHGTLFQRRSMHELPWGTIPNDHGTHERVHAL